MKTLSLFLGLGTALLWNAQAIVGAGRTLFASCPINSREQQLNFSGVAKACGSDADADKCNACVCAVNDAFIPAFRAANIIQESTEPAVFPKAKADEVLRACVPAYLGQVTAAGVELSTLAGLQDCPVDASPACLSVVNQKLRANADDATATGASTAAPTAPSTTGTDQAINAVQNVVGRVSNAGQQVVEAGQSAVNAGQSAAQTIRSVFNG